MLVMVKSLLVVLKVGLVQTVCFIWDAVKLSISLSLKLYLMFTQNFPYGQYKLSLIKHTACCRLCRLCQFCKMYAVTEKTYKLLLAQYGPYP